MNLKKILSNIHTNIDLLSIIYMLFLLFNKDNLYSHKENQIMNVNTFNRKQHSNSKGIVKIKKRIWGKNKTVKER